jgi:hypothetical protein
MTIKRTGKVTLVSRSYFMLVRSSGAAGPVTPSSPSNSQPRSG